MVFSRNFKHGFWNRKSTGVKKHPRLYYGYQGREGFEKVIESGGTFEFYDSRTYCLLATFIACMSLYLWQDVDWAAEELVAPWLDPVLWKMVLAVIFFYMLLGIAGLNSYFKLRAQYHLGQEQARRQLEWIYLFAWLVFIYIGIFAGGLGFVQFLREVGLVDLNIKAELVFHANMQAYLFPYWAGTGLVLSIMFSMFYRGAIDPRLVIRKSTIYAIIAIIMTVLFVAIEGIITSQAVVHLGMPTQTGAIIAGSVTAVVFGPIRNKVEEKTNALVESLLPASALAEGTRYEAVVVFNDLSGYTKMTEEDEETALTVASLFHKEGRKAANTGKGRVVKTIGDAVLMEFRTVSNALQAVTLFHEKFHRACDVLGLPQLPVHSGMHVGMVVKAPDGDIYGSTVNIAARLEGVAGPDEIVISNIAKTRLEDKDKFKVEPIGEQILKNVPEPLACFRLV